MNNYNYNNNNNKKVTFNFPIDGIHDERSDTDAGSRIGRIRTESGSTGTNPLISGDRQTEMRAVAAIQRADVGAALQRGIVDLQRQDVVDVIPQDGIRLARCFIHDVDRLIVLVGVVEHVFVDAQGTGRFQGGRYDRRHRPTLQVVELDRVAILVHPVQSLICLEKKNLNSNKINLIQNDE